MTIFFRDFLENLKLKEFYRFVHQHKKIGVPFEGEEDDVKSIEKWPIIRAYAIDGKSLHQINILFLLRIIINFFL